MSLKLVKIVFFNSNSLDEGRVGVVQLHQLLHMHRQARQAVFRVVVQREPRESVVAFQHKSANKKIGCQKSTKIQS